MLTKHNGILLLTLLVAVCLLTAIPAFAEQAGTVTALTGQADILRVGAKTAVPLKLGDSISVGDIVRTKSNGRAEITFVDNSVMKISPRSRLGVDEYLYRSAEQKRVASLKLYRGQSGFQIPRAQYPAAGSKFEMKMRTAVAGVRGTEGFLVTNGDEKIYVTDGSVEVTTPLGSMLVTTGMVAVIVPGQPPLLRPFSSKELHAVEQASIAPPPTPQTVEAVVTAPGSTNAQSLPIVIPITQTALRNFDLTGSGTAFLSDGTYTTNAPASLTGRGIETAPGTGKLKLSFSGTYAATAGGGPATLFGIVSSGITSDGRTWSINTGNSNPVIGGSISGSCSTGCNSWLGSNPITSGSMTGNVTGTLSTGGTFSGNLSGNYRP